VNRAAYLESILHATALPPVAVIETTPRPKAKATRHRWTPDQCDALALLVAARPAGKPGYRQIAAELSDWFGVPFTSSQVGTKARALKAKASVQTVAAPAATPASAKPTRRRKARG